MPFSLSILHISDLHRDRSSPIGNGALMSSLQNDRDRYAAGLHGPAIRPPDIVVVSGDIIRGVPPGTAHPEEQLANQYGEAMAFLDALTERLLDGDRDRLVLVPGNHDVSACHFMQSLERLELNRANQNALVSELLRPDSSLRWCWQELALYRIGNATRYAQRLAPFADFYADFYRRQQRTFDLDSATQFAIFDYPALNLTVTGFSSCHGNDFFNKPGSIHPESIAAASLRLRDPRFNGRLRAAVWHHNTEGPPAQTDYMNASILQNFIDSGFSLGLHGHQHRPQHLDTRFQFGGTAHISIIAAGTLCGTACPRFGRAYNIIELDMERQAGRLHVREMLNDAPDRPIWGCRPLPPDTSPYLDFHLHPPPPPVVARSPATTALQEAQRLHGAGAYREAADVLLPFAPTDDLARRLLLDCLDEQNDTAQMVVCFDPPRSSAEAICLMDALWLERSLDRLRILLHEPCVAESTDPAVAETRRKYEARLAR